MRGKKCRLYMTCSTEQGVGVALDKQKAELLPIVEKNGYDVTDISYDIGPRGNATRKPEFQKLMNAAAKREFDVLLVRDLTQLAGNNMDIYSILQYFHSCGVEVQASKDNVQQWEETVRGIIALSEQRNSGDPGMVRNKRFIEEVNDILAEVDFTKLDESCNGNQLDYAKSILARMHRSLLKIYETDHFTSACTDLVDLPAVVKSHNTGRLAIGLVTIDLESSGEHYGTAFFTGRGVLQQGALNLTEEERTYLKEQFIPYDYWYTPYVEGDIHESEHEMPITVQELINACYAQEQNIANNEVIMT